MSCEKPRAIYILISVNGINQNNKIRIIEEKIRKIMPLNHDNKSTDRIYVIQRALIWKSF